MPALCPRIKLTLTPNPLPESDRVAGEGSIDQVRRDFEALEAMGASYVLLDTFTGDIEATRSSREVLGDVDRDGGADFGVAKVKVTRSRTWCAPSRLRTRAHMKQPGGDISPEQAMGEATDFRFDPFSLGLVTEPTPSMLIFVGIGRLPVRFVVHLKGGLHQDHPKTCLPTPPAGKFRPLQGPGSAL